MIGMKVTNRIKKKLLINIGATLDVPTASFITGARGETIMNGGLSSSTAVAGPGNSFKSTLIHYMMLSAANRMTLSTPVGMHTYDTEINIDLDRLGMLTRRFDYLTEDIVSGEEPSWTIADKNTYSADKWIIMLRDFLKEKESSKDVEFTAFKDPDGSGVYKHKTPYFAEVDSFSEFESETTMDMLANSTKDDGSTNTLFMRQGLFKTKFLSELPGMTAKSNTYMFLTAHIGESIDMGGMYAPKPTKKLQYIKAGDKLKGVSSKFFFLTSSAWMANTASVLKNQSTKLPEYPIGDDSKVETDLNLVSITQLRSKHGASGYSLSIVISQVEGVLPSLTEFHHIKSNNRYGLSGSLTSYSLDLLPDVKLSRTTVRRKIDNDVKLRRVLNITSEMLQIEKFHPIVREMQLLCTPKELYEDIKALGYDWDTLLDTRGWWTIDQYNVDVNFLSTMDLLKMRKKKYIPYWLSKEDKAKLKYEVQ